MLSNSVRSDVIKTNDKHEKINELYRRKKLEQALAILLHLHRDFAHAWIRQNYAKRKKKG